MVVPARGHELFLKSTYALLSDYSFCGHSYRLNRIYFCGSHFHNLNMQYHSFCIHSVIIPGSLLVVCEDYMACMDCWSIRHCLAVYNCGGSQHIRHHRQHTAPNFTRYVLSTNPRYIKYVKLTCVKSLTFPQDTFTIKQFKITLLPSHFNSTLHKLFNIKKWPWTSGKE